MLSFTERYSLSPTNIVLISEQALLIVNQTLVPKILMQLGS